MVSGFFAIRFLWAIAGAFLSPGLRLLLSLSLTLTGLLVLLSLCAVARAGSLLSLLLLLCVAGVLAASLWLLAGAVLVGLLLRRRLRGLR